MSRWLAFETACALLAPSPYRDTAPLACDWETFVAVASEHMVAPALHAPVARLSEVPDEALQYFDAMHDLNRERNAVILASVETISGALTAAAIEPIFMKGAASLVTGLYDDPAERFVGDIDLLVPPAQLDAALASLVSRGFKPAAEKPRRWVVPDKHHLPVMIDPDTGAGVEIHSLVLLPSLQDMLPADDVRRDAETVAWRGREMRVPNPTHRILHNVVHDQLSHGGHERGWTELRQLRELAFLAERHREGIDWAEVDRRFARAGQAHVLASHADVCATLMRTVIPSKAKPSVDPRSRLATSLMTADSPAGRLTRLRRLARLYAKGFMANPRLALNLLNPAWWPGRLRTMLALLRQERRGTPKPIEAPDE